MAVAWQGNKKKKRVRNGIWNVNYPIQFIKTNNLTYSSSALGKKSPYEEFNCVPTQLLLNVKVTEPSLDIHMKFFALEWLHLSENHLAGRGEGEGGESMNIVSIY